MKSRRRHALEIFWGLFGVRFAPIFGKREPGESGALLQAVVAANTCRNLLKTERL
jgi:hypothetical protein